MVFLKNNILLLEMNFWKFISYSKKIQIENLQRKKYGILKNILFLEMKILKLINYSTNMCQSCGNAFITVLLTVGKSQRC